jgi:hypothetical protein
MAAVIRRMTLAANTLTILPKPAGSGYIQVSIGNACPDMLFVYSGDTPAEDTDNFLKIGPGADRLIRFNVRGSEDAIVYLKSQRGGEVVLIWG